MAVKSVRPILILLFVGVVLAGGIELRRWTWENTRHLRFQRDIVNGFHWGSETLIEARRLGPAKSGPVSWTNFFRGYLALYDRVKREAFDKQYHLDYPPLRLLVMSIWAKNVQKEFPGVEDGTPDYVEPLLEMNLVCEALAAVAIFLIVRLWLNRTAGRTGSRFLHALPPDSRGWICGLAAATAAWLDPSLILDAHGWPQWDVWLLPFYLFAVLAGLKNRWFWCGCILAVGAMLKGQLLLVTPFFLLWPLWQKKWMRALCVLFGFGLTMALLVSPWLLRNPTAWIIVGVIGVVAAICLYRLPLRQAGPWLAGTIAASVFVVGGLTGGSFAWLEIGLLYGSEHYPYLYISSCYNLPSLLADVGCSLKQPFWSAGIGPLHFAINLQWTLRTLYLIALALCALGATRHERGRDPRLLIAIAAPWLAMFALLGQMHERYLMWGVVVCAVAWGVSVRMILVNLVLSAASTAMIVHVMLMDKKLDAMRPMVDLLDHARPYGSWIVLACVAFYFREVLSTRVPTFCSDRTRSAQPASLTLAPAPEQA